MKAEAKFCSSKSSKASTMTPCVGEKIPCHGFRLRRRPSVYIPLSRLDTNTAIDYIQTRQYHTKSGIKSFESAFGTLCTTKSFAIPPDLKLPSFDDDDDDNQLLTKTTEKEEARMEYSSVRFDLNLRFDAVALSGEEHSNDHDVTKTSSSVARVKFT